jgi:Lrp/AsnC family leucine-responsive transcriptional regulator
MPPSWGYQDSVIVQGTLESHSDETLYELGRVLATIPEVQEAYLVSGDYDSPSGSRCATRASI